MIVTRTAVIYVVCRMAGDVGRTLHPLPHPCPQYLVDKITPQQGQQVAKLQVSVSQSPESFPLPPSPSPPTADRQTDCAHTLVTGLLESDQNQLLDPSAPSHCSMGHILVLSLVEAGMGSSHPRIIQVTLFNLYVLKVSHFSNGYVPSGVRVRTSDLAYTSAMLPPSWICC